MTTALTRLYRYQANNFSRSVHPHPKEAYPETAEGIHLDGIARALRIRPRLISKKFKRVETDADFRERILLELAKGKPENEDENSNLPTPL